MNYSIIFICIYFKITLFYLPLKSKDKEFTQYLPVTS